MSGESLAMPAVISGDDQEVTGDTRGHRGR